MTHPSFTDVFLGLLLFVDYYWCLSVRWSVTSECMPAMGAEASAFEQTPLGEGAAFLARGKARKYISRFFSLKKEAGGKK